MDHIGAHEILDVELGPRPFNILFHWGVDHSWSTNLCNDANGCLERLARRSVTSDIDMAPGSWEYVLCSTAEGDKGGHYLEERVPELRPSIPVTWARALDAALRGRLGNIDGSYFDNGLRPDRIRIKPYR